AARDRPSEARWRSWSVRVAGEGRELYHEELVIREEFRCDDFARLYDENIPLLEELTVGAHHPSHHQVDLRRDGMIVHGPLLALVVQLESHLRCCSPIRRRLEVADD